MISGNTALHVTQTGDSSPSQKSNTSGWEHAGRESDSLAAQNVNHAMEEVSNSASVRAVLLSKAQDSNLAPSESEESVGSSMLEPGETGDHFVSASRHNAQRFRARRERNKPGNRGERLFRCFYLKRPLVRPPS